MKRENPQDQITALSWTEDAFQLVVAELMMSLYLNGLSEERPSFHGKMKSLGSGDFGNKDKRQGWWGD